MELQRIQHLIDEHPLMVLPTLAKHLGINQAIILQQVHFVLKENIKRGSSHDFVDGYWWAWNTYEEWQTKFFSWLPDRSLRRYIAELEDAGLLVSRSSVKHKSDRRKWYRVDYDVYQEMVETWAEEDAPEDELESDNEGETDPSGQNGHMGASGQNGHMVELAKLATSNRPVWPDGYSETPSETPSEGSLAAPKTQVQQRATPPAQQSQPSDDVQNQPVEESTGKEKVRSTLEVRIYNKFNSYPTRKAMRWLEHAEDLVKDNGERVKQPTPIERYDEDENFRLYANEQIDYWVDKSMREDGSKSVYIIRLAKALHFVDGKNGYHNWLKGHKKPLPADSDVMPIESIEF